VAGEGGWGVFVKKTEGFTPTLTPSPQGPTPHFAPHQSADFLLMLFCPCRLLATYAIAGSTTTIS
jgi:hypothetical protein